MDIIASPITISMNPRYPKLFKIGENAIGV